MALSVSQTSALITLLKPGMKICSFGYPDVIAPLALIEELMGDQMALLEERPDSKAICQRHGLEDRPIPDAHSLFKLLDCELDVYDIVQERGCEIILNLNEPMEVTQQYDIVLDVGTLEHCFNIGQAITNMAIMVKEDGYIVHENPFNWGNHGFYNLNPTFFHDFYEANGFELKGCALVTKNGQTVDVPLTQRFKFVIDEINIFTMAQRKETTFFVYPMQSKYRPVAEVRAEKEIANG